MIETSTGGMMQYRLIGAELAHADADEIAVPCAQKGARLGIEPTICVDAWVSLRGPECARGAKGRSKYNPWVVPFFAAPIVGSGVFRIE
jgi:hypothetical protein